MKKILIGICVIVSINSFSQDAIDTIYSRYVQLQWEDLKWLVESSTRIDDSLEMATASKIKEFVKTIPGKQASTLITLDSVPGRVHKSWYDTYMSASRTETLGLSNTVRTNLRVYAPMVPFLNPKDEAGDNQRKKKLAIGAFIL